MEQSTSVSSTAISATRRAYKEMADGTLRVQFDIDPMYKNDFLKMFPEIDTGAAIAPLVGYGVEPHPQKITVSLLKRYINPYFVQHSKCGKS